MASDARWVLAGVNRGPEEDFFIKSLLHGTAYCEKYSIVGKESQENRGIRKKTAKNAGRTSGKIPERGLTGRAGRGIVGLLVKWYNHLTKKSTAGGEF